MFFVHGALQQAVNKLKEVKARLEETQEELASETQGTDEAAAHQAQCKSLQVLKALFNAVWAKCRQCAQLTSKRQKLFFHSFFLVLLPTEVL